MPATEILIPGSNFQLDNVAQPTVPYFLEEGELDTVERCLDTPFVRHQNSGQLLRTDLVTQIIPLLTYNPGILLFTAYSAIPMADVFRGIYKEARIQTPAIGVIATRNSNTGRADYVSTDIQGKNIAIIDEFQASGRTIRRAITTAKASGANQVMPVTGQWYQQASINDLAIDKVNVTSVLAPELHNIGKRLLGLVTKKAPTTV